MDGIVMRQVNPTSKEVPIGLVGSTKFGRYPKESMEQTYNMIVSDEALVPYAGYLIVSQTGGVNGRGIYASARLGQMILVIDSSVYTVTKDLDFTFIGSINTNEGDVFIDENEKKQIALCDKKDIWIYDYSGSTATFTKAYTDNTSDNSNHQPLDFVPGYITYQDGRFIAPALGTPTWRISDPQIPNNFPTIKDGLTYTGTIQTKGTTATACLRVPSKGNLLYVFGDIVTENWYDVGATLFPYQRSNYVNSDFGCINSATIASNDNIVVWLAGNEKSGPSIMVSYGGETKRISNDGIDFKLASLSAPEDSFGFLFRQDGHVIYQLTFPTDNISYIYDFNTEMFFTVTNQDGNYHIARRVAFFNNTYYFISDVDGNLYEMNTKYTAYSAIESSQIVEQEIPRFRFCPPIRTKNGERFICNNVNIIAEEGYDSQLQRVELALSTNGGLSFSSFNSVDLNPQGYGSGQINFWQLGSQNDLTLQFRFYSLGRFVLLNGTASIR